MEYPLAGIGSRFLGVLYDTLIQAIIYFVLFLVTIIALPDGQEWWNTASKWLAAAVILLYFLVYWGYYAIFETLWKGQTPGKRQAGIRVIKEDGRSITAFDAAARNLIRVIDALPGIYAVGIIAMFLNKRHKRLGDFVAGTVVVHERTGDEGQVIWSVPADSSISGDTSILTDADLQVIETFLERRIDLPAEVRQQTGQRLADMYAAKLNIPPESRGSNEDLLETIAIQHRNELRFRKLP